MTIEHTLNIIPNSDQMLGSNLSFQGTQARNVAEFCGGSKPERLCAFCVYAFCVCRPLRPEMLRNFGAGASRKACVHFACMRSACADLCGPKCCGIWGREQTGRLVCILRVCVLRVQTSAARNAAESGGGSKPERLCASNLCSIEICKILANFKRVHIRVKPYKALIRRVCMCFAY